MTVREFYSEMEKLYPASLSAEWDNDGLMLSPDPTREVYRILAVLDVTDEVVRAALDGGFDLILSHHPLIFRPLRSIDGEAPDGRRIVSLLSGGISVLSFHTRADAAEGGVNDLLAAMLGLCDVRPFADGLPRIGRLPAPMDAKELIDRIKRVTGAPYALTAGKLGRISTVAVCGGAGKEYARAAAEAGADLYLTGELGYHARLDAEKCLLCEIGHDYSEMQIVGKMAALARRILPGAKVTELPLYACGML
jgi:dinuclear metal center YbgI/SA1388 family protein